MTNENTNIPKGRGVHPNSLKNLKRITSETARANQRKSAASRSANVKAKQAFKLSAKQFQMVMSELPELSSLDVIKMAMHKALQADNMEDAVRYANLLTEFEAPKLTRVEQNVTTRTSDLSDEELQRIISEEGLNKNFPEEGLNRELH